MTVNAAVTGTDPYLFRQFMLRLAKTAAVVTWSHDEAPHGFTTPTVTQVSHRPQLISFCAESDSAVLKARHFAVHLLAADQRALARRFASAPPPDRFGEPSLWRWGPYRVPVLPAALATMFCELAGHLEVGATVIVLGRPTGGTYRDGEPLQIPAAD